MVWIRIQRDDVNYLLFSPFPRYLVNSIRVFSLSVYPLSRFRCLTVLCVTRRACSRSSRGYSRQEIQFQWKGGTRGYDARQISRFRTLHYGICDSIHIVYIHVVLRACWLTIEEKLHDLSRKRGNHYRSSPFVFLHMNINTHSIELPKISNILEKILRNFPWQN